MEDKSKRAQIYAESLKKMIQCATVSMKDSYNDIEFAKLREVMERLFPLVHQKADKMIFSNDCWLYKINGTDSQSNIVLMSHHDVAPVTGEWQHAGFSGDISDGKIWGRGTVDTKTSLFAEFTALEEALQEGKELVCNVYLASSHNEEIAGDGIPKVVEYFRENGIEPNFVLDEGGAVIEPPMAGINKKCSVLAVHEKGRHTLELCAKAQNEHTGLSVNTQTPVMRMAEFMVRIQKEQPYIRRFTPELKAMFEALAPHMKFPMSFIFSHLNVFSGLLKGIIPKMNAQAGAMLGTTGTFNDFYVDKENQNACMGKLFLRPVVELDLQEEIARITKIASEYGISVKNADEGNEFHAPASMEGKAWNHVKGCMMTTFPETITMPFILPAGTDARHFSEICHHVYRFAPIDIDNQQFGSVHGVDENICVDAIVPAVDFYKRVIEWIK